MNVSRLSKLPWIAPARTPARKRRRVDRSVRVLHVASEVISVPMFASLTDNLPNAVGITNLRAQCNV